VSLLEASGIVSGYGDVEILHGVSIHVEMGEIVAIIGPNGAGKSTLLKTVFGLLPVNGGRVVLSGVDITGLAPHAVVRQGICYVPQADNVFPSLSILENLEMGAYTRKDGFRRRVEEVFAMLPDLASRPHLKAAKLSGGQRQMLALARALMLDPKLLLLDEPTASLSPKLVDEIFAKVMEINAGGVAVLLVEQNAKEALALCNRGYVMANGHNRLDGPGQELLNSEEVGKLYLGA